MRLTAVLMLACVSLAACGERADEAARQEPAAAPAVETATPSPAPVAKAGEEALPVVSGRYYEARQTLLRTGYTPRNVNERPLPACLQEQQTGEYVEGECPEEVVFPELEDCSGTGMGLCLTRWVSPGGRALTVVTAGEPQPGTVHRVEWEQP